MGQTLLTIGLSIFGSGAVFGFIQFLISRHDNKDEKFKKISEEIQGVKSDLSKEISAVKSEVKADVGSVYAEIGEIRSQLDIADQNVKNLDDKLGVTEATNKRVRILRAADEIRLHVRHSKEWFDQLNEDITDYEMYCETHPGFKNNQAVQSIIIINNAYKKAFEENDFL